MSDWAIRHVSGDYWTGDRYTGRVYDGPLGRIVERFWEYGPLEKALRFATKEDAETAYRGDYRPAESCCQPVEVP